MCVRVQVACYACADQGLISGCVMCVVVETQAKELEAARSEVEALKGTWRDAGVAAGGSEH